MPPTGALPAVGLPVLLVLGLPAPPSPGGRTRGLLCLKASVAQAHVEPTGPCLARALAPSKRRLHAGGTQAVPAPGLAAQAAGGAGPRVRPGEEAGSSRAARSWVLAWQPACWGPAGGLERDNGTWSLTQPLHFCPPHAGHALWVGAARSSRLMIACSTDCAPAMPEQPSACPPARLIQLRFPVPPADTSTC